MLLRSVHARFRVHLKLLGDLVKNASRVAQFGAVRGRKAGEGGRVEPACVGPRVKAADFSGSACPSGSCAERDAISCVLSAATKCPRTIGDEARGNLVLNIVAEVEDSAGGAVPDGQVLEGADSRCAQRCSQMDNTSSSAYRELGKG